MTAVATDRDRNRVEPPIGIVAAGRHRGDAFRVCVNRDRCEVHFASAKAAAKRRRTMNAVSSSTSSGDDYWERERKRQAAEAARRKLSDARWAKAAPTLLPALARALKKIPGGAGTAVGRFLINQTDAMPYDRGTAAKYLPIGTSADELVRHIVFAHLAGDIDEPYDGGKGAIEHFKLFGVNAKKILDEVAPEEKPEKKPAKKAKK